MSDKDHIKVFHHTDRESAKKIMKSGKILQSTDTKTDAVAGKGTYVTKYGPDKSRDEIARNNYDGASQFYKSKIHEGKADVAIEMKIPSHKVTDRSKAVNGRDVHVHKGDISLQSVKDLKVHVRETGSNKYQTFEPSKQGSKK